MKRSKLFLLWLACIVLINGCAPSALTEEYAKRVASLIDPAKLATLRERGANPRVQKYVAHLEEARTKGVNVTNVVNRALELVAMERGAAELTGEMMLRNLVIAERLGCLDEEGLKEMRQGKSPTVMNGPYAGDQLSVDHIIPRSVVPELDKVIANLELMPMRMNASKNAKIGQRQIDLSKKLKEAGLLTEIGLRKVLVHQ